MSLTIGQTLYFRLPRESEIKQCKIIDIKRKYFFVDKMADKFKIEDLRYHSNHSHNWDIQLYLTKEEILKKDRNGKLKDAVDNRFRYGRPTMEQYEAIAKILNIEI
jgi:hypothetical protein